MNKLCALLAVAVAVALPALADSKPAAHSGTPTCYGKGKQVGRAITHRNTTTYDSKGKPFGTSIRRR